MLNILLVDDSLTMRKVLQNAISSLGKHNFYEAGNGKEALDMIEKGDTPIDCIFLDINMPVMGGLELIKALREKGLYEKYSVILSSTEILNLEQSFIDELNVTGVIPKPFKQEEREAILIPLLELVESKRQVQHNSFSEEILIVDDSITMRKILQKQLGAVGCEKFHEASNGKKALEYVTEHMDTLKLLFVDIHMPVMDGIDFVTQLDKAMMLENFEVVMMSNDIKGLSQISHRYDNVQVIEKPFKQNDLNSVIIPILNKLDPQSKRSIQSEQSEGIDAQHVETGKKVDTRMSVKDCVTSYFTGFNELIESNMQLINSNKKLDYFIFKEFLELSFNYLRKLDPGISTRELQALQQEILELEKRYRSLAVSSQKQRRELFETIFLDKQKDYKQLFEKTQKYSDYLQSAATKLQKYKAMLQKQKGKENSKGYEKLQREYQALQSKCRQVEQAIEKNNLLMADYKSLHHDKFELTFNSTRKQYKKDLQAILHHKCYRFDKLLWSTAGTSSTIYSHFVKKKVAQPLSAHGFLKYYLKHGELTQENPLYKELLEILQLLQNRTRKMITVVAESLNELEQIKQNIENHNRELQVKGYTHCSKLLSGEKQPLDLIILDYQMKGLRKELPLLKERYKDTEFLLLFRSKAKSVMLQAIEDGMFHTNVKNYLYRPKYLDQKALCAQVEKLL